MSVHVQATAVKLQHLLIAEPEGWGCVLWLGGNGDLRDGPSFATNVK